MKKNAHNGCFDLKVFEIGRVFFHRKQGELPIEKNLLGCLITGQLYDNLWSSKMYGDFFDLKGCIENVFDGLKISDLIFRSDYRETFLNPGKSCGIYVGDQCIAVINIFH
jgi:phenylalanyl-tRNA synthetase beta chain